MLMLLPLRLVMFSGKISVADSIESHRDAVRLATLNALTAAQACLHEGEKNAIYYELSDAKAKLFLIFVHGIGRDNQTLGSQ